MELVTRHGSGKHPRVVLGINLITLLWTDGESLNRFGREEFYAELFAGRA